MSPVRDFQPSSQRCPATGKACWSFRQVSQKVASKRRRGDEVNKYHCRDCGWWHFGHSSLPHGGRRRRKVGR